MAKPIQAMLYDVARGMKGDVTYIENLIVRLADYGYNMLVLYLEYRFRFPSHPVIGTSDSLSPEDIRHLDQVARKLGVELVPCVNSAGHCEGFGYLEKYKHLTVDPTGKSGAVEQLKVGDPQVLRFIDDLYNDLFACFSSPYFHIGADEIRHLDKQMSGASEEERWNQTMEHVLYVIQLVKNQGKIPMMFGDMLLKHRNSIGRIPDDVIIGDWAAFSDPLSKGLSNLESQSFFKNAGKKAIACPSINSYQGHPIVSVNSTMNLTSFFQDQQDVFGPEANGVMLNLWEFFYGNFFSKQWPWIYMLSRRFKGEAVQGMDFLRAYTKREWGVDTDELMEWYDLVDVQSQKTILFEALVDEKVRKSVTPTRNRAYKLLRPLVMEMLRSVNILPVLYQSRNWLNHKIKSELRKSFTKAAVIAETMYTHAEARKEEPQMLLEWTHMFIAILDLSDLLEKAEFYYHEAALIQGSESALFTTRLSECTQVFHEISSRLEVLVRWTHLMVDQENASEAESWWIHRAHEDLMLRMKQLEHFAYGDQRSLLSFDFFIRAPYPDIPFVPSYYKMRSM